ncbi:MAG: glycoside hydrolase family 38 C-terminal domain-containing protein [Actinomycetaceae bacterium]|nr:glycoside hydrolase family 38 C-terminal domain-containing protein [Actinomycetaceae bacterium]
MHENLQILESRVRRTLIERIYPAVNTYITDLKLERFDVTDTAEGAVTGQGEPITFQEASRATYTPTHIGTPWGPAWGNTWFKVSATAPKAEAGKVTELHIDLGWADHSPGFQCEAAVYDAHGTLIKALNPKNQWLPVHAPEGQSFTYFVEASAVPLLLGLPPFIPTDEGRKDTASPEPIYRLSTARVVQVDVQLREFAADLEALLDLCVELEDTDPRRWELATTMSSALNLLDLKNPGGNAKEAQALLQPLLSAPAVAGENQVFALGHAHIDTAWLWPLRETRRKVVRTLANVVNLLDSGEDFVFALPAAQHLAWIEQDAPALFERIKEWVGKGKIELVGGMWIEPDAVLPGGESLVRQLLLGQQYFQEHFGRVCEQVWLPDSFGYSGALPQLAKGAGARWFLTQKISWNQVDTFPHHTFWWEGIDGTRIFTHFPPVDTYNSSLNAKELLHGKTNFRDKGKTKVSLAPFGYGDGGGGPVREMLWRAKRYENLAGVPQVRLTNTTEFIEAARADYPDPETWVGELYLELHRGTFTSQANTKRGNRFAEGLAREAELWCATAATRGLMEYPAEALTDIWKRICLYQFHDILPGTSIGWVYDEGDTEYTHILEELRQLRDRALRALEGAIGEGTHTRGGQVLANAAPYPQTAHGHTIPPMSALVTRAGTTQTALGNDGAPQITETDEGWELHNSRLRARIDRAGLLTSLVDVETGRESIPPGEKGGMLVLHQDFPNMWDAWDVDIFYQETAQALDGPEDVTSIETTTEYRADGTYVGIRLRRRFGDSWADISWTLGAKTGLGIHVEVDWHQREQFLKMAWPLDIHTQEATFETQFGHVTRPIHTNTSWDAYRFEVNAQRWVHVQEPGFGVGLSNSRTYGWDVTRGERPGGGSFTRLRASLLRAPLYPDPQADQGFHTFDFELLPGATREETMRGGYRQALPIREVTAIAEGGVGAGTGDRVGSDDRLGSDAGAIIPALVEVAGATVEAVKCAEDQSGDVIVRVYESSGGRKTAKVVAPEFNTVTECDLLERPLSSPGAAELPVALGNKNPEKPEWTLNLHPFQVVTLRLGRK